MKIRRSRPTVGWTQIPNVVARDYRLSWRARGLLLELLSYPPGWETTIDELVKRAQRQAAEVGGTVEGRDAMRAAARELKAAGYLVVTRSQDTRGRWRTDVEVTDAPMWDLLEADSTDDGISVVGATSGKRSVSAGRTEDGIPGVGSPGVGSSGVPKKTETKKETPPPPRAQRETAEAEEPIQQQQVTHDRAEDQAAAILKRLPADQLRRMGSYHRARLVRRLADLIKSGSDPDALAEYVTADLSGPMVSLYAVITSRLREVTGPLRRPAVAVVAPADSAPQCSLHPGAARRAGGQCAGCWADSRARESA